tara:strand:- start:2510 stop:2794 length:285 start_codon:yes stop_codon:yes gene_type:complete
MIVVNDDFRVCSECLFVIVYGEVEGLENYHDNPADRLESIESGIEASTPDGGSIHAGNSEKDETFSWSGCECCNSGLGGSRHHCVILAPKGNEQ